MSFWVATLVVSTLSIVVLIGLLFIYARNFRSIKSTFSIGLLLFAVLFLVHNVISIGLTMTMMASGFAYPSAIPMSMLLVNVAELAGFGVLFWISWE